MSLPRGHSEIIIGMKRARRAPVPSRQRTVRSRRSPCPTIPGVADQTAGPDRGRLPEIERSFFRPRRSHDRVLDKRSMRFASLAVEHAVDREVPHLASNFVSYFVVSKR